MEYKKISMEEFHARLLKNEEFVGYQFDWSAIELLEFPLDARVQLRFANCLFKWGVNISDLTSNGELFTLKFDHCVFATQGLYIQLASVHAIEITNCSTTSTKGCPTYSTSQFHLFL